METSLASKTEMLKSLAPHILEPALRKLSGAAWNRRPWNSTEEIAHGTDIATCAGSSLAVVGRTEDLAAVVYP